MTNTTDVIPSIPEPPNFGDGEFPFALVTVTNACNLRCGHCFVYRDDTPSEARDKMDDETMLYQLRVLRDKHNIKSMLFFGGEPMIRSALVFKAMNLFEKSSIVTNGTYGIPSVPGHLVTVSLDGPESPNDTIRGAGVFQTVKKAVFERNQSDGTTVMLQMTITKENQGYLEEFLATVADWPVDGVAFTFYVPDKNDTTGLGWTDLKQRDDVVRKLIELKHKYPFIKANKGALELMFADVAIESTGVNGENCNLKKSLPLYMGKGGQFERTFCCYGNNVDCSHCGAYAVFNGAYHQANYLKKTSYRAEKHFMRYQDTR